MKFEDICNLIIWSKILLPAGYFILHDPSYFRRVLESYKYQPYWVIFLTIIVICDYSFKFITWIKSLFAETFPLESVPLDLQSVIMEKMLFTDFNNLARCSEFTQEMRRRKRTKLVWKLENVSMTKGDLRILSKNFLLKREINLEEVKEKFLIHCKRFNVYQPCLKEIRELGVKADTLYICSIYAFKMDTIERILSIVKPRTLAFKSTGAEILKLDGVRKLKSIKSDDILTVTEEMLLGLEAREMEFKIDFMPTFLIARMVEQWKEGKRVIEKIKLKTFGVRNHVSIQSAFEHIPFTKHPSFSNCVYVFRNETECIKIEEFCGNYYLTYECFTTFTYD